jgi:TPR repeat protein
MLIQNDPERVFRLYRKAFTAGYDHYANALAGCYVKEIGVSKNAAEAHSILSAYPHYRSGETLFFVAKCYEIGDTVPKDPKLYIKRLSDSKIYSYHPGVHELGIIYEIDSHVPQNLEKALQCYLRVAYYEFPESLNAVKRFF